MEETKKKRGRKKKRGPKKGYARKYEEGTLGYAKYQSKIYMYWQKFEEFRYNTFVRNYKTKKAQLKQLRRQELYGTKGKAQLYEIKNEDEFRRIFEGNYHRFNISTKDRGKYAYNTIINLYRIVSSDDATQIAEAIWARVTQNKINTARKHSKQYQFNNELINWYNSLVGVNTVEELADLIYNQSKGYNELMNIKNKYFPDDSNIEAFYA